MIYIEGDVMRLETKYRILVISMFVVLLMFGIYIGFNMDNKKTTTDIAKTVINEQMEEEEVSIYAKEKKYDIELVYEDEYTLCSHRLKSSDIIYNTTLTELKKIELDKQKKEEKEYEVKEETKDRVVFYRAVAQNCPNHFNVKLENGVVVIYNIVNDSVNTVYQKIDIAQELIRPEMIEELNVGIKVDSKEELNLIIEDLES